MNLLSHDALKQRGIPYTSRHLNRLVKADKFPKPVYLGPKSLAWIESEINEWIEQRVAARNQRAA